MKTKNLPSSIPAFLLQQIEVILVFFGAILLFIPLNYFSRGGVLGTDIVLYINLGLNGIKDPSVLHRYFHILFEGLFLKIAPTPLLGAQMYWAFLVTATCLLIYLCGRSFSKSSRPLHGILAVITFLAIEEIADTNGTPGVDLTAMFVVMLLLLVYLSSARSQHRSKWLLVLMGFLFYMAFKTKETTIIAGILIIGLGFTEENKFNWGALKKNLLYFLGGMFAGLAVFAFWTWVVLDDPFFGLRPSEWMGYITSHTDSPVGPEGQKGLDNWFTGFFFTSLLLPFILYIISGVKSGALSYTRRLVWLVPLMLILFVSVSIGNKWGLQARFIFPVLPIICILWPQPLFLSIPDERRSQIISFLYACCGVILFAGVRLLMPMILPKLGWDTVLFINLVFYPFLLVNILILYFLWDKLGFKVSITISLLVVAVLIFPLTRNIKTVFILNEQQQASGVVFYPFSAFSSQIKFAPGMRMYISDDTWSALGNPWNVKNRVEILSTFNTYFGTNASRENFTYGDINQEKAVEILTSGYGYIIGNQEDWQQIISNPDAQSILTNHYDVYFESKNILFLLKIH